VFAPRGIDGDLRRDVGISVAGTDDGRGMIVEFERCIQILCYLRWTSVYMLYTKVIYQYALEGKP
jgi:hypothetical protein